MTAIRVPLTTLDEAFLNLDETVTWSVQFEVGVTGRFDEQRLRNALRTACDRHPMTRARLADARTADRRRHWLIEDANAGEIPLTVEDCPNPDVLGTVRAALYQSAPELDQLPAVRFVLARTGDGDVLLANLHHVAFDGMSAVRLFRSISRAYRGAPDPSAAPPLPDARDLTALAGAKSITQRLGRIRALAGDVVERTAPIARIAASRTDAAPPFRFGVTTLRLRADEVGRLIAGKPDGTTVNDVMLAALLLTVRRWNAGHGQGAAKRATVMMPVNLRPSEWSTEVLSNFASYLTIPLAASAPDNLTAATSAIAERTSRYKKDGIAGWMVDLLEPGNSIPVQLKSRLQQLLPIVQARFLETTVLSNLGRLTDLDFGEAGAACEVWFSPPCFADLAAAVGVATVGDELFVTVRYLTDALDAAGAADFADLLHRTLTG